mgnify:CR=1 FL=1
MNDKTLLWLVGFLALGSAIAYFAGNDGALQRPRQAAPAEPTPKPTPAPCPPNRP